MAKIQLKSGDINPFGGLFSILNIFNRSGLRAVIDQHLGWRGLRPCAVPCLPERRCGRPSSIST